MHHNVVVLEEKADIEAVGKAALTAKDNGYIPSDYERNILAFTEMATPGEITQVTFTVPPPGEHLYLHLSRALHHDAGHADLRGVALQGETQNQAPQTITRQTITIDHQ